MAVEDNNLKRFRGDDDPFQATIKEDGAAINITGFTVKMSIALPDGTVSMDGVIVDAQAGKVEFSPEQSHIGTAGRFSYDVELNDGTYKKTYVKAILELVDDVTK